MGGWSQKLQQTVTVEATSVPPLVGDVTTPPVVRGVQPFAITFHDASTGGTGGYTYRWDFYKDGMVDSTEKGPTYTFTRGTYAVKLTVTDSEGRTATPIRKNLVGVSRRYRQEDPE